MMADDAEEDEEENSEGDEDSEEGDCSIIKTHILVPPSIFSKYFFFGPRPSLQKITNANTNTNEDRKDDLQIFHREMITNLTPC